MSKPVVPISNPAIPKRELFRPAAPLTPLDLPFHPKLSNQKTKIQCTLRSFCVALGGQAYRLLTTDVEVNDYFQPYDKHIHDSKKSTPEFHKTETWYQRRTAHSERKIPWEAFHSCILQNHSVNEYQYTPDIYDCQLICEWPLYDPVSDDHGPIPRDEDWAPRDDDSASGDHDPAPDADGTAPDNDGPAPDDDDSTPNFNDSAPKYDDSAPKYDDSPPEDDDSASKYSVPTPEDHDSASETPKDSNLVSEAPEDPDLILEAPKQSYSITETPVDPDSISETPEDPDRSLKGLEYSATEPVVETLGEGVTLQIYEMAHRGLPSFTGPTYQNRVFPVLVLTKDEFPTKGKTVSPINSFLVVQTAVDLTGVPEAHYSNSTHKSLSVANPLQRSDFTIGHYARVEHCFRLRGDASETQWNRALCANLDEGVWKNFPGLRLDRMPHSLTRQSRSFFEEWARKGRGKKSRREKLALPPVLVTYPPLSTDTPKGPTETVREYVSRSTRGVKRTADTDGTVEAPPRRKKPKNTANCNDCPIL